ncbi:Wzz/FepE/Etk N-terminal domain-containing protein [Albimonas sp. CAU 1670]|uniref:GumC family protein n=1 Tax=Albimonas sp. CAU 1670 TaxID=3032599 RepID=UPI0023DA7196|nr:Wzz/FepE/Etk N-terminal domain-containing protein [Albimonas sp. CAU 1670]MDF2231361.1 Wzz/FepE/Etk N-terminal domain-containing protein [Albimonas sp. CAU 1670]
MDVVDDFPGKRQDDKRELPERLRQAVNEPPGQPKDDEVDLLGLVSTIWQRKWIVAAFGFGFAILAIALAYSLTPRYTATSIVMLDRAESNIIDVEAVTTGLGQDYYTILAQKQVLQSRSLAERVVESMQLENEVYFNPLLEEEEDPSLVAEILFGGINLLKTTIRGAVTEDEDGPTLRDELGENYWVRQVAVDTLLGSLAVDSVSDTYVYSLSVTTENPVLSTKIANKMAELYITDQLETKFEATQAATEWLSDRVAQLKVEVEDAEAAVEAYNSSTALISEAALAQMNRQLKELRERRADLERQQVSGGGRQNDLRALLEAGDYAGFAAAVDVPRLTSLAQNIEEATGETRVALEETFQSLAGRMVDQAGVEEDRTDSQLAGINASIAGLETQLESQTQDLVQLRQLQREAEASRRIYEQFLRRLNETSVQEGTQQADARVLSEAVVPLLPSYPNKTQIVLVAGFLGGVFGIAYVLLIEQLNKSFRSSDELEKATGLPVMGQIPVAPVRLRRGLLDYAVERPSSGLVEAIRNLRTGVMLANIDRRPEMIMLTSTLPKEGKTTCSLLLAQNAAGLGKKVLLIECDLRRRTFRTYFPGAPKLGMMSILSGDKTWDEVVYHDERTGLDVIMGEETKVNAADVFHSQRFQEFLAEARRRYDFVVIDTPPVMAVPDSRVIAPMVDAVIYCVRWNSTHKDLVRAGLAQFSQIKVSVSGLALTQINLKKMARYGYGGYNYYYYKSSNRYYLN